MRREGRQHGMVLTLEPATCPQPPPRRGRLLLGASGSPPTTAFRTRVPARPTNQSKYTGKGPAGLRQQPSSKSRDKSKGARKLRDLDVGLNPRLASWRVAGGCGLTALGGGSASAAVVYLSGYPLDRWGCVYDTQTWLEGDEDLEGGGEEEMEEAGGGSKVMGREGEVEEERGEERQLQEEGVDDGGVDDSGEEEDMGFCEVWYVWDYVDEEDWCVVGEEM